MKCKSKRDQKSGKRVYYIFGERRGKPISCNRQGTENHPLVGRLEDPQKLLFIGIRRVMTGKAATKTEKKPQWGENEV